jgi:hypothetical protein
LHPEEYGGVTSSPSSGTVDTSEYDPQENNEGDEEQELADETNTSIPGGRTDPSHTPTKYRYDTYTKSVHPPLVYLNELFNTSVFCLLRCKGLFMDILR